MDRILIALLSTVLLAPGTALAQTLGASVPGLGANDWNEEPNVLAPGRIPSDPYASPSAAYPADANGIALAKAGGAPVPVLQSKWIHYFWPATVAFGTASGVGLSGLATPDANNLLHDFTGKDYIWPATAGSWIAFYGQWTDLNGDGFRDEEGHWRNSVDGHDRPVFLNLDGRHACTQQDLHVAPEGSTRLAGGQQGNLAPAVDAPVTVEYRCTTPDEWSPPEGWDPSGSNNPEVVTYVTPGDEMGFAGPVLRIPCPIVGVHKPKDCDPDPSKDTPDVLYTAGDFFGPGTYSWDEVFFVTLDGSLLETKVAETISEPVVVTDGPRTHEAGANSLVDVDVYQSFDPLTESLFQTAFHGAEREYNALVASTDDDFGAVYAAYENTTSALFCSADAQETVACPVDPVVGPLETTWDPPRSNEAHGYDYLSAHHLYLDFWVGESYEVPLYLTAANGNFPTGVACDGLLTPDAGNGGCKPVTRLTVFGVLGAWHDKDADGFVGDPDATATCPDAHDCGRIADPNEYDFEDSEGEWIPTCLPGRRSGYVTAWLTPDGGRWGTTGAYVFYDEGSGLDSTQGGRASFNPYDDVALDAEDGDLDRLVTTGSIEIQAVCTGNDGFYNGFQEVVVFGGRLEYGVTLATEPVTLALTSAGIENPETVQDTDVEPQWQI